MVLPFSFVLSAHHAVLVAGCHSVHSIRVPSMSIICNLSRQNRAFCACILNADVCAVPLQAPTLTMEGGRLKRSLQLVPGRDFETVPEPVWRALYHWYGANLSLPRPVSGCSLLKNVLPTADRPNYRWLQGNRARSTSGSIKERFNSSPQFI